MFAWGISPPEAAVLCVLAVLLFGRKLPEIASSVGRSLRVFQDSWRGVEDDVAELRQPLPRPQPPRLSNSVPHFDEHPATPEAPPTT